MEEGEGTSQPCYQPSLNKEVGATLCFPNVYDFDDHHIIKVKLGHTSDDDIVTVWTAFLLRF